MWTPRLRVPSPPLVVSIVALIVALGGTSYAAFSLPRGSVGTPQLKNKAVTNGKLAAGSVGPAKIKDGAVTAGKINTSGLTVPSANTLNGIEIVRGPDLTLAPGAQGVQGVVCPTGKVAIGGNGVNNGGVGASINDVRISNGSVAVHTNNAGATSIVWHGYAVCVSGSVTGAAARPGGSGK
jgi:hypothetical protein